MLFIAFIQTYLFLYPIYNPIGGVRLLEEAWNLLSGDVQVIFRIADSNLDALNTVDLGPSALLAWVNARCGRG